MHAPNNVLLVIDKITRPVIVMAKCLSLSVGNRVHAYWRVMKTRPVDQSGKVDELVALIY
jgi:hypothetical protein